MALADPMITDKRKANPAAAKDTGESVNALLLFLDRTVPNAAHTTANVKRKGTAPYKNSATL